MTEYKTRRGALLAGLEHHCIRPGEWLVEGWRIIRVRDGCWTAQKFGETHIKPSFERALEYVAGKTAA